jgi:hypothetical protein
VTFPTTAQRRRGLGPVKKGNAYGVLVHAMLAVDAASGSCLGLVGGDVWSRDGVNPAPHRQRPLAARESAHWVDTAQQAKSVVHSAARVTVVADRVLAGEGMLFAAAGQFPVAGRRSVELPARDVGKPRRTVVLELRYGEVAIRRPSGERDHSLPPSVKLRLIEVRAVDPPAGEEPLHWRLLTTHTIADAAAAWEIVGWYQRRWVIEQLFRVMKSQGLQVEDSQMASADRLVKLAATATKAACIDIQLTQSRDGIDQMPAANVFTEPEIDTLAALQPTLEGSTERQQNRHPPLSLAWAAWTIARLGGWNCYYKPPGPITFRRGMQQFYAIHRRRLLEVVRSDEDRWP